MKFEITRNNDSIDFENDIRGIAIPDTVFEACPYFTPGRSAEPILYYYDEPVIEKEWVGMLSSSNWSGSQFMIQLGKTLASGSNMGFLQAAKEFKVLTVWSEETQLAANKFEDPVYPIKPYEMIFSEKKRLNAFCDTLDFSIQHFKDIYGLEIVLLENISNLCVLEETQNYQTIIALLEFLAEKHDVMIFFAYEPVGAEVFVIEEVSCWLGYFGEMIEEIAEWLCVDEINMHFDFNIRGIDSIDIFEESIVFCCFEDEGFVQAELWPEDMFREIHKRKELLDLVNG